MNPLWPLEKGLTSLKTKQRGICIWSRNTPTALCLNITWLEGLSILKTASSSSRNLPLFEMCKTAPENWLVTPWAATLSTLLQNQVSVSERPFLNLFLWRFFCLVGLVFLGVFSFFFKMSRAPQATPLERLLQTDVLPWGCRGSADEDSIDSPLVALLLWANTAFADPC